MMLRGKEYSQKRKEKRKSSRFQSKKAMWFGEERRSFYESDPYLYVPHRLKLKIRLYNSTRIAIAVLVR